MEYTASSSRYANMNYRQVGSSGLKMPALSLGLWQNFGSGVSKEHIFSMLSTAFDNGITHFDLANNYGPVYGAAEQNFGEVFDKELSHYRDEMLISTKAGFDMWEGPYGDGGSKKYLISSLNQSLKRMKLDYVDIFYHHRYDPETPLEEVAHTLDLIVRQGKALYVGVSNYPADKLKEISDIFSVKKTPFIIDQPRYNMLDRNADTSGVLEVVRTCGIGAIAYSPLARGALSGKYIKTPKSDIKDENIVAKYDKLVELGKFASVRGATLTQLAIIWLLSDKRITSVLMGASKVEQILENVAAINMPLLSCEEKEIINTILDK